MIGSFHHYFPSQLKKKLDICYWLSWENLSDQSPLAILRLHLPCHIWCHFNLPFREEDGIGVLFLMPLWPFVTIQFFPWMTQLEIYTLFFAQDTVFLLKTWVQVNNSGQIIWSTGPLRLFHRAVTESNTLIFTLYFMVVGTQDTSNKVSNGNIMPLSFCALPFSNISLNNSSFQRPVWKSIWRHK